MSGHDVQQEAAPIADAIDLQAAHWIERHACTDWCDQDSVEFEEWIAASPAHRIAYLRLHAGWKRAERLAALRAHGKWRGRPSLPILGKIAAAFGVVALLSAGVAYYMSMPRYAVYATNLGERETLTLRDGTHIELNTDTVIQIPNDGDRRHVHLEKGEAYFEVVHNATHPFVVFAGRGQITDLGTKFVVRRDPAKLQVTLLQGSARFDELTTRSNTNSVVLQPGEAIISSEEGTSIIRRSDAETARQVSWRRGVLIFSDARLAEAVAEFNRYNHVKIVVADQKAASVQIGGTFATANVDGFVRVAQGLIGLHVKRHGDEIVISR